MAKNKLKMYIKMKNIISLMKKKILRDWNIELIKKQIDEDAELMRELAKR